jgi:hypothetical protein
VLKSGYHVPDALGDGSVDLIDSKEDVAGVNEKWTLYLRAVSDRGSRVVRASESGLHELDAPGDATVHPINSGDKIASTDPRDCLETASVVSN